jgi:hypothetical protein
MGAPEWIARLQSLVASAVHLQSTLVHAAQRLPGFQFDETMAGKVTLTGDDFPSGERDLLLKLRASVPRLHDYLRDGRTTLTGSATLEGLVESAPLTGSLWIWPHRQIVRYELYFPVGNQRLRLSGQKDVRLFDFRHTMSTLPARLYDESGREVGHGTVLFDWADLPSFLRSFTPISQSGQSAQSAQSGRGGSAPTLDADAPVDAAHLRSRPA